MRGPAPRPPVYHLETVAPAMPDWAPNPHPFLVHFPIALLTAAAAVDLLSLLRPAHGATRDTATWLYCAGAFTAMAAYFSGLSAAAAVRVTSEADLAVTTHFVWVFFDRTTWFFVFFASLRLAMSYIWRTTARWALAASCALSLAGLVLLAATAMHGGRLVFQYGLGVESVPPGRSALDDARPGRGGDRRPRPAGPLKPPRARTETAADKLAGSLRPIVGLTTGLVFAVLRVVA